MKHLSFIQTFHVWQVLTFVVGSLLDQIGTPKNIPPLNLKSTVVMTSHLYVESCKFK